MLFFFFFGGNSNRSLPFSTSRSDKCERKRFPTALSHCLPTVGFSTRLGKYDRLDGYKFFPEIVVTTCLDLVFCCALPVGVPIIAMPRRLGLERLFADARASRKSGTVFLCEFIFFASSSSAWARKLAELEKAGLGRCISLVLNIFSF